MVADGLVYKKYPTAEANSVTIHQGADRPFDLCIHADSAC
jgi:hypothetical protein